MTHEKYT
jgi:hypothetical protein